ncbi:MAG: DNA primase [Helicobacter sp.]|nr:DNA primase [Helicobacter sp.]
MITKDSIEQLKDRIDIVEIISSYIDLRKAGTNFSACCPFHNEKTPSFIVSPARNSYHCYGCGVGGDCISFVMEYEHLNFTESVEKIAEMIGFTLTYEKHTTNKKQSTLLEDISRFYERQLLNNAPILEYLKSRGISQSSIELFKLGYAPANFETLKFINANNLNKQEALEFGVIGRDSTREYARFSERVIFPIHSNNAKIVGFGGRSLDKNNPAKYINSPQSRIFNKSKLLYGYHIAKDSIFREKRIIICEGYIDVIMLHQAGFKNTVATLGTALTEQHLPLLKKLQAEIILSYDGDNAGVNAALKAAKILSKESAIGGVVLFSNNLDPADMIANNMLEELKELFTKPIPFVEFVLQKIITSFNITDPLLKQKALQESLAFLKTLTPLLQTEYANFVANALRINPLLIKINHKIADIQTFLNSQNDIAECTLIFTLIENPEWIDIAAEYIDSSVFMHYAKEYILLLQGKKAQEDKDLRSIWLNSNLKAIRNIKEFKEHLRILITQAYKKDLQMINKLNTDPKQKLETLVTIRNKLTKLLQGELISYEKSFGTF